MSLKSMTGFARTSGTSAPYRWAWEIKAVNSKGLDLRLRLPPGFDMIEAEARARISRRLARGTCYATLSVQRDAPPSEVRVNEAALAAVVAAVGRLPAAERVGPLTLDGLLSVRGIVEVVEAGEDAEAQAAAGKAALAGLDSALDALVAARSEEGAALTQVLARRLERIGELTSAAENAPGRKPEAVRARLSATIGQLAGASPALDPVRLHSEALLLAAKADIREELDRLATHVAAGRDLVASPEPVGRRLDFLAQELAREANTLCAKSNDAELTAIGMELRVEIEQFREQVQNIE
jgi:uncharacterized protein (TIGR00255 family)